MAFLTNIAKAVRPRPKQYLPFAETAKEVSGRLYTKFWQIFWKTGFNPKFQKAARQVLKTLEKAISCHNPHLGMIIHSGVEGNMLVPFLENYRMTENHSKT